MQIDQALRIKSTDRVAFAGGGGKTTAMFCLSRQIAAPVWASTTTHLAVEQTRQADRHFILDENQTLDSLDLARLSGVTLFTGSPTHNKRIGGLSREIMAALNQRAGEAGVPLLIEADGSKTLPIKAPESYEPVIPEFVNLVVYVVGMDGLGVPLDAEHVHRPERFSALSGLPMGEPVSTQALARVLTHPSGGLKEIPPQARRVLLLNKADTPERRETAAALAKLVSPPFDAVIAASLGLSGSSVYWVKESAAAIILAAGASKRLGRAKQLIEWNGEPLVRRAVKTAMGSGLDQVIVVSGAYGEEIESAVSDLPVEIVHNPDWAEGQSGSMKCGLKALRREMGAAVFMLSDQPWMTTDLVRALLRRREETLAPIVAPFVGTQRSNPVIFDRDVFADLFAVGGDIGGRAVFRKYSIEPVPWSDQRILIDIDREEDYQLFLKIVSENHD